MYIDCHAHSFVPRNSRCSITCTNVVLSALAITLRTPAEHRWANPQETRRPTKRVHDYVQDYTYLNVMQLTL